MTPVESNEKMRGGWVGHLAAFSLVVAAVGGPLALGAARPWFAAILVAVLWIPVAVGGVAVVCGATRVRVIPSIHGPLAAMTVYALIRYLAAPVEYTARMSVMTGMAGILALATASLVPVRRDRGPRLFVALWTALGLGLAVYGLWQTRDGNAWVYWIARAPQYDGRASGTWICPNHLAGWYEITLPWLASLCAVGAVPVAGRIAGWAAVAAQGAAHLFTLSRGGWLAVACQAVAFVWMLARKWWQKLLVVVLLIAMVAAACVVLTTVSGTIRDRVAESRVHEDTSFLMRVHMWRAAGGMWRENPVAGIGPGMYEWEFLPYRKPGYQFWTPYAHSDYLQWLAENGVVGVAMLLVVAVGLAMRLRRTAAGAVGAADRAVAMAVRLSILGLAIHSVVDFNLHIPANMATFAIALGLAAARGPTVEIRARAALRIAILAAVVAGTIVIGIAAMRTVGGAYLVWQGDVARDQLDHTASAEAYREAVARDPTSYRAWDRLGDALGMQARWNLSLRSDPEARERAHFDAIDAHAHAHRLCPWDPLHEQKRAGLLKQMGRYEEAEAVYRELIERHPNDAVTFDLFGTLLVRMGRIDEAVEAFHAALDRLPRDEMALRELDKLRRRGLWMP